MWCREPAALQNGGAIETIGLMGIIANATQIIGGILVFGDPLSPSPLGIVFQVVAFAMVCFRCCSRLESRRDSAQPPLDGGRRGERLGEGQR